LATVSPRANAQNFSFSAAASANSIGTNGSLTYTISLTNGTGLIAFVTNALSGPVQFVSASPASGLYLTNSTTAIFDIDPTVFSAVAQLTVTVQSTSTGVIDNAISVVVPGVSPNVLSTNILTQVTNAPPAQADLAVSMTGPAQAVITNDYFSYGVTVSNLGPSSAPAVFLTNGLPPGVRFISVLPSSQTYTQSGSNVLFGLGTLANGATENFFLRVQPTNAGTWAFSAAINSANITDPNPTNNPAVTNIVVENYLAGQLVVTTNSAQSLDLQDGLVEQWIQLSNVGTNAVASARIVVSGLTNVLYNAVGTNGLGASANPFVVNGSTLAAGESVNLLLQFWPNRKPFQFANSQLHAYEVPPANLAPPSPPGTPIGGLLIFQLLSGSVLVEFPTITNRTYRVVYSDNVAFSNAFMAQPSGIAAANRSQWIDYGPPATVSHPTNTPVRFYRVFLAP
jgi:uncharacterized repeat protein (TIGR01451 family)